MHCGNLKSKKAAPVILIISLLLLLTVAVGSTMAYIKDAAGQVTNTFMPAEVIIDINENVRENRFKENISFTNRNTEKAVPVYIRATLVIHWTDVFDMTDDGTDNPTEQIIPKPVGASVTISNNLGSNWIKVGDIYYYTRPVGIGSTTEVMLQDAIVVTVPDGSTAECHIDIHAEAIQAEPASAVNSVWTDVKVDGNGHLTANGGAQE